MLIRQNLQLFVLPKKVKERIRLMLIRQKLNPKRYNRVEDVDRTKITTFCHTQKGWDQG